MARLRFDKFVYISLQTRWGKVSWQAGLKGCFESILFKTSRLHWPHASSIVESFNAAIGESAKIGQRDLLLNKNKDARRRSSTGLAELSR